MVESEEELDLPGQDQPAPFGLEITQVQNDIGGGGGTHVCSMTSFTELTVFLPGMTKFGFTRMSG